MFFPLKDHWSKTYKKGKLSDFVVYPTLSNDERKSRTSPYRECTA